MKQLKYTKTLQIRHGYKRIQQKCQKLSVLLFDETANEIHISGKSFVHWCEIRKCQKWNNSRSVAKIIHKFT